MYFNDYSLLVQFYYFFYHILAKTVCFTSDDYKTTAKENFLAESFKRLLTSVFLRIPLNFFIRIFKACSISTKIVTVFFQIEF